MVHLPTKDIKFKHSINELYYYKPTEIQQNENVKMQLLSSLEDNKRFYSTQQFERAKKARNLYHALGHPSIPVQENDMDEIDPNELGVLLEDTNNMPTQEQVQESQESHNQQMISESESEE